MAFSGKWEPLIAYLVEQMEKSMGIRDLMAGEKALQAFLNVYLGLSALYLVYSEKEWGSGDRQSLRKPPPWFHKKTFLPGKVRKSTNFLLFLTDESAIDIQFPLFLEVESAIDTQFPLFLEVESAIDTQFPLFLEEESAIDTRFLLFLEEESAINTKVLLFLTEKSAINTEVPLPQP